MATRLSHAVRPSIQYQLHQANAVGGGGASLRHQQEQLSMHTMHTQQMEATPSHNKLATPSIGNQSIGGSIGHHTPADNIITLATDYCPNRVCTKLPNQHFYKRHIGLGGGVKKKKINCHGSSKPCSSPSP